MERLSSVLRSARLGWLALQGGSSRSVRRAAYYFCLLTALLAGPFAICAAAQIQPVEPIEPIYSFEGYITRVGVSGSFDVNGRHVATSPETAYRSMEEPLPMGSPVRSRTVLEVGVYVGVTGTTNKRTKTVLATKVYIRHDEDWTHSGLGVIDTVISAGSEPVFRTDGYRIRITPSTKLKFSDDLKSLAEVGTKTWLRYEGALDDDGVLVATKARFLAAKSTSFKAVSGVEVRSLQVADSDSAVASAAVSPALGRVPGGELRGQFKAIDDPAVQARVQRIGMSLVPAYQKALADDHPSRIQFRFLAVDDPKARAEICSTDGLILVPQQAIDRLRSDDELAAVLADGVAMNMQRQAARLTAKNREILGIAVAEGLAGFGLFTITNKLDSEANVLLTLEKQRGRVALALMHDAGYDLAQAPEAWRLLEPKKLPADLDSLEYPDRSGYQLSIIRLEYKGLTSGAATASSAQ